MYPFAVDYKSVCLNILRKEIISEFDSPMKNKDIVVLLKKSQFVKLSLLKKNK